MGSELEIQNDRVRITRWCLQENEETGPHLHEYDYVVIPIMDARMAVRDADGSETMSTLSAGVGYFREAGAQHNVWNPSQAVLHFVEVELLE